MTPIFPAISAGAASSVPSSGLTGTTLPVGIVNANLISSGTILHSNGTTTAYPPSADTAAARGTALLAAKAAAVSGETVIGGASVFDTYGLAKAGVNYRMEQGSTLSHSNAAKHIYFDDSAAGANAALAVNLSLGNVVFAGLTGTSDLTGVLVNLTNPASDVNLDCGNIVGSGVGGDDQWAMVFGVTAGKLRARFRTLVSGSGIWWVNGDLHITGETMRSRVYAPVYAAVLAGATMTGKLWVEVNIITGPSAIYTNTSNGETGEAQVYVTCEEAVGGGQGVLVFNGCRNYVLAKGKLTNTFADQYAVIMASGAAWVSTPKIRGLIANVGGGFLRLKVGDLQDDLGSDGIELIIITGGDNVIEAGILKTVQANGITLTGGVLVFSGTLDTSAAAGTNPVNISGGNFICSANPRFISPSGQESIAGTGVVSGHFIANTAIGSGITARDGYTLDDGTTVTEVHPGGALERTGAGSPEGVFTAPISSIFHRTDGGASTSLYVKTSGAGNTGWTAK